MPLQCFSRELLAIYLAVKHFRHLLEGRDFTIFTDHKPLVYALKFPTDRHSPREANHLDFISQFTTDIRHLSGSENVEADTLSRFCINNLNVEPFSMKEMALQQRNLLPNNELGPGASLQLRKVRVPGSSMDIWCDVSQRLLRPFVPMSMRRAVFEHFHGSLHPSIRASVKMITNRFVWPSIRNDVRT